ncbi:tRNA-guanine transglycosylase DpdA [Thalassotalea crassostreae]|uniref:tRNA-guanine transglycosylase DpdA n=1 Tax=Thalassotalea crassostreae TaxID=1763536 RepID=UPI000837B1FD|nr:tRNA-guanine transglycosylase DpdA [Thalassotalea crassostreae]
MTTFNYYFPDNLDFVDPKFNGITNEKTKNHRKYDDDAYPHEILKDLPYNGMLVSLAGVGTMQKKGKYYTQELTEDFYYYGAKKFLRLDNDKFKNVLLMGDCGAFDYVNEPEPPYTLDELIEFYERGGFDCGISLDHIVFQYAKDDEALNKIPYADIREAERRINITLKNAEEFYIKTHQDDPKKRKFIAYGVAHGFDKESFISSVKKLEEIGYRHITIGGMIKSKTPDLLDLLETLSTTKSAETQFHLLGICRFENIPAYAKYGVTSADSTSPLMQGIKAGKYFDFNDESHELIQSLSIRIRQCDHENVQKLIDKHRNGIRNLVSQMLANNEIDIDLSNKALSTNECVKRLESDCIKKLIKYDANGEGFESTFKALMAYEKVTTPDYLVKEMTSVKKATLAKDKHRVHNFLRERPWKNCSCGICESGIMNIVFRSNQTNRRRGIHNLAMVTKHKDKVIDVLKNAEVEA